jgi:hypothetical protein
MGNLLMLFCHILVSAVGEIFSTSGVLMEQSCRKMKILCWQGSRVKNSMQVSNDSPTNEHVNVFYTHCVEKRGESSKRPKDRFYCHTRFGPVVSPALFHCPSLIPLKLQRYDVINSGLLFKYFNGLAVVNGIFISRERRRYCVLELYRFVY